MGDDEFAAVGADEIVPELIVKEGEDIDYRVVLAFYLIADLAFVICFVFAREEGYWVTTIPFLPLTFWMAWKVHKQQKETAQQVLQDSKGKTQKESKKTK
mmetsp:Transcript_10543/g.15114  ORF Transcript_10543/g.15114 Transcript_10543/m.15114 type:complete len:100 (+) Transcript_10543:177-476(+)|eukprot:CAMPEP_0179415126 /NCGR_PEP_ID=MMETSP0799-20121207/6057_1 /TAXON_ID=46947 /ORGANISM="Geminigera cryophila, Strain CCMP2564" /LENGTH=99 /DNA_ID=CAMNT_0021187827 /DNA_START=146 /DNA_END=445 /DNA_ORIENTATION=-